MREKNEASHWAGSIWHMELHGKTNLQKALDRETKYNIQKTKWKSYSIWETYFCVYMHLWPVAVLKE